MNAATNSQSAAAKTQPIADVAVIGAGIVGSAIARELAGYELSVTLVEARSDVGDGTSKANTAILHTGYDAKPGTLESRLVRTGYHLLSDYADRAGIPVERTGAMLVAWDSDELAVLPALKSKAAANGYDRCEVVDAAEVYRQVPDLGTGALGGLTVPDESIICTWTASLALATDARLRGTDLRLGHRVTSVSHDDQSTTLHCGAGDVRARWVINAAGLGCDHIDQTFGYDRFHVVPRRGELLVFDKLARPLVNKIVLPVPTARGKGVLISPTIYGNIMLGPTAEDLDDRAATGTTEAGFDFLLSKGRKLMPRLLQEEVTAGYAGLRAAIDAGDYLIEADADRRYLLVGGIRSTGLTSSMAIAGHVRDLLADAGLKLTPRSAVPGPPRMPNIGEAYKRPYQDDARIARNPSYGRIVCFCERVTAGEIWDASRSPIPPLELGGLRRRTRAMNGRCQGFFCGAEVSALFESCSSRGSVDIRSTGSPCVTGAASALTPEVLIIGGGPAGLSAAASLAGRVHGEVLVLEREQQAGGIPRHSNHLGFGTRDMRRFITGPAYAQRLVGAAEAAGATICTQAMVTGWDANGNAQVTSPQGRLAVNAKVVVLAMGARERPRSARLIPATVPPGCTRPGSCRTSCTCITARPVTGQSWSAANP